jgi:hypothetical protein
MRKTIVVSGALANRPGNGGGAWVRLSWINGLRRLGFDVHFVELIASRERADGTGGTQFFDETCRQFGFNATLLCDSAPRELLDIVESAELLVNIGGHLTDESLRKRFRRTAYIDIDPGFTQFWHVHPGTNFRVPPHDSYYTIASNIGRQSCEIPAGELPWRTMLQPVVLEDWPVVPLATGELRLTTVASWRGAFGPVSHGGRTYGVKAHEFRKFASLPKRVPESVFEVALDIHPGDAKDMELLSSNGWRVTKPCAAAGSPAKFRDYVQASSAEFSVAQGIYVDTDSGWFSDRTVRYLATGRPALVQDTGFSGTIPSGEGLVAFRTLDEAVRGVERIAADHPLHCATARRVAEEYFDSDKVLGKFLDEVGVRP